MNPVSCLAEGATLRGLKVFARNCARPVFAFLGVPFADPPKRFAPPRPLRLWQGERDATKFGAVCPQNMKSLNAMYFPYEIPNNTSEDCLFLNVWTPTLDRTAHLPVMVWVHGGGYEQGCSNYYDGTAYAALHDIVFVAFNYRLGVLGLLCTGDDEVRGNMAFLDQREALCWVQKYIEAFGGDPKNVTLFGESAGALSVCWHLVSPGSRGLFHRAILESGSMVYLQSVTTPDVARRRVLERLEKLGLGSNLAGSNGKEIVELLNSKPLTQLIDNLLPPIVYPVIDGELLPDHPRNLIAAGKFAKVDAIFGFNADEGYMFINEHIRRFRYGTLTADKAQEILKTMIFKKYFTRQPNVQQIYNAVYNEYLAGVTDADKLLHLLSEIWGDILFIVPTFQHAVQHADTNTGHKTFLYEFHHRSTINTCPEWIIATHSHEIPFVIGEPFLDRLPDVWTDEERRLSALIMAFWSQFAKTGDPNSDKTAITWPQLSASDPQYAVLQDSPRIGSNYRSQRMKFWLETIHPMVTLASIKKSNGSKL